MPRPNEVHQNKTLENISIAYMQEQTAFVAPQVFPIVPVLKNSDAYYIFNGGDLLRDDVQERGTSSKSSGTGYGLTTATYNCLRYAAHQPVDWETIANQDGELVSDIAVTKVLTQKALIKFERVFAANYFAASKWTGSSTGSDITPSTKWDTAGSTPILDVETQKYAMQLKCGFKPNVMVVSPDTHVVLKNHADIIGRLRAGDLGIGTEQVMAQLFGVDKYLVAEAAYNSAAKGDTDVYARIFGTKAALLTYANPSPSIMTPSGGYIFASKQFASNNWGLLVRKWEEINITSNIIEVEFRLDAKLVSANCGVYFTAVIA